VENDAAGWIASGHYLDPRVGGASVHTRDQRDPAPLAVAYSTLIQRLKPRLLDGRPRPTSRTG
jgi:hypothetical protein